MSSFVSVRSEERQDLYIILEINGRRRSARSSERFANLLADFIRTLIRVISSLKTGSSESLKHTKS